MRSRGPLPRNFWFILFLLAVLVLFFRLARNAFTGGPVLLRILPIGDSITQGFGSSDDNGYRLYLQQELIEAGHTVEFVGSQSDGFNNKHGAHDGWSGAKIHEIASNVALHGGLRSHPNIILIHAGTNDIQWDEDEEPVPGEELEYAHYRLTILLDEVVCENPDAVILVARVVGQVGNQERTDWFNFFVNETLTPYREKGYHMKMVDHSGIGQGNGYDLIDGLHPNDAGYHKMALQWFRTIHHLPEEWVKSPRKPAKTAKDRTCEHDDQYWYEQNHKGLGGGDGGGGEETPPPEEAPVETMIEGQAVVVGEPAQVEKLDSAALRVAGDQVAAQPGAGSDGAPPVYG